MSESEAAREFLLAVVAAYLALACVLLGVIVGELSSAPAAQRFAGLAVTVTVLALPILMRTFSPYGG